MADNHPIRSTAVAESGVVEDTLLEAMVKRIIIVIGAGETLGDFEFSTGDVPLAVFWAATGYVYTYDSTDTTTADDGLTTIVTGDGKRYHIEDAASVSLNSILSVVTSPPGSPTVGDVHRVGASATGDFAGQDDDLAVYTKRGWVFATPQVGHTVYNQDTAANEQYIVAGWDSFVVTLSDGTVYPAKLLFPLGVSVEAQQNAPPGSPTNGQAYLVGTSGSGDWAGQDNKVAVRIAGAWGYISPYDGAQVHDKTSKSNLQYDATGGSWGTSGSGGASVCEARLTTETGVAISTSDRTAQATIYLTKFRGNRISVYAGGQWSVRALSSDLSLSLSGLTSGKPYDVFIYDNSGTLTLESLVWTNDTTRATALTTQDGVLVKSGDATRRYLGTFYANATGQTADSLTSRYLWNYYNRVERPMRRLESTNNWGYETNTWRQANGSSSNQLNFIAGVAEDMVECQVACMLTGSSANTATGGGVGIGLSSTSALATGVLRTTNTAKDTEEPVPMTASLRTFPAVGRNYLAWLEYGVTDGVFIGDTSGVSGADPQSGIHGTVMG